MDFYLEAQTDMVYYKDCFSRMHYLFKPIPSIAYCIELLKVASQILFQDLLSLGVKNLAASVWSISEEKQIHEFYEAGHLPFVTASDLRARLLDGQPLTEEDQKHKLSQCSQEMLSGYLRHAIPNDSTPGPKSWREALCSCPDSSIKFAVHISRSCISAAS
ncbi:hypothetical protein M758_2G076500 [Ceratodon purpureus]|nr:hypothetical protein M758_2G076500 [Ceratodon purpureus]